MKKEFSILFLFLWITISGFSQDTTNHKTLFYKDFLTPSTTIGLSLYSRINNLPLNRIDVRNFRTNHFSNFHHDADDYFQFVPLAGYFGLHFTSLKSKSDFLNKTILFAKSELLMAAIVYPAKYLIGEKRPSYNEYDSYPSGHTTQAFVAAQLLWREYGENYPVIGYSGYAFAIGTAIYRILNDVHWSADVLAGAGVGILAVNLVYLTHKYRFGKKKYHLGTPKI